MSAADRRRWLALGVLCLAVAVAVLDTTVLTVAIPTIIDDLDTELRSVQWVVSGYALTYASLLILGGRMGDLYGPRRMFIVGMALFGAGSLIASGSQSVVHLLVGEAVIEGIGAALMMPATMTILSRMFTGRDRATAFAFWGAMVGAAAAFGPVMGGYLTTYHSWRWAFRVNMIVAPLAIIGALRLMPVDVRSATRERLDLPGAVLISGGLFLMVLGIIEAPWRIAAWVASAVLLVAFVGVERWKEARAASPLFDLRQFRTPSFRYGVITALVLIMGQIGMFFVLAVFLQDGRGLSALDTGFWLLPVGVTILVAAQISGRLTRHLSTTLLVRAGMGIVASSFAVVVLTIRPAVTFPELLPGLVLFGLGVGISSAQLTNVILLDIEPDKVGSASGANTTARQIGAALGAAILGTMVASGTDHRIREGASHAVAVAGATRPALILAGSLVTIAFALSFLIPRIDQREPSADLYDVFEPVDTTPQARRPG